MLPRDRGSDAEEEAAMLDHEITAGTLHLLREAVLAHAAAAGMPKNRAIDIMLAVHELAANVVRHGGGTGQVRIRSAAGALLCQVTDPGRHSAEGRPPASAKDQPDPWPYRPGHGLWLVRQTADQVRASTGPHGSQVTVSFALPSPA